MANKSLRNFIGGEFVDAASGQTADVISPVTGPARLRICS